MTDPQVLGLQRLRKAIQRTGLSNRQYAEAILTRDERTLRRWLAGQTPIPKQVLKFLAKEVG